METEGGGAQREDVQGGDQVKGVSLERAEARVRTTQFVRNFTKLLLFIIRHLVAMETAMSVQHCDGGGEGGMVSVALMFSVLQLHYVAFTSLPTMHLQLMHLSPWN